jgi:hypothetical protein
MRRGLTATDLGDLLDRLAATLARRIDGDLAGLARVARRRVHVACEAMTEVAHIARDPRVTLAGSAGCAVSRDRGRAVALIADGMA